MLRVVEATTHPSNDCRRLSGGPASRMRASISRSCFICACTGWSRNRAKLGSSSAATLRSLPCSSDDSVLTHVGPRRKPARPAIHAWNFTLVVSMTVSAGKMIRALASGLSRKTRSPPKARGLKHERRSAGATSSASLAPSIALLRSAGAWQSSPPASRCCPVGELRQLGIRVARQQIEREVEHRARPVHRAQS